ncbi:MAG: hypothetical protein P4L84_02280 [Isosphaeraceae bacterium]|nr:hypothetical protein [Isosphaeraceae bacterium]
MIVIVLLVSAVTLPAVLPALSHRQVSEAARILQASLVQARDTAIRFNAPRGVRFLPDPTYASTPSIFAYNRMVPLEPGPEYSNGLVTIWPAMFASDGTAQLWSYASATFPPAYPAGTVFGATIGGGGNGLYPLHPAGSTGNPTTGQVLMIEQAPFVSNDASQFVNAPTSWFWNIRVGDQIQINNTGQTYTVVGPCTINPFAAGGGNPELFVNNGQPGDRNAYLQRTYTGQGGTGAANPVTATASVEFLLLVNGIDDDKDGYVDNGWDGVDNNQGYIYNGTIDDQGVPGPNGTPTEWEVEKFTGTLAGFGSVLAPAPAYDTTTNFLPKPMSYTITRRPVVSQSARETMLPNNVVIDATTIGGNNERSRLPADPFSGYVDILLLPSGQVVPTTTYSSPASFTLGDSFYHFWLSERVDVHAPAELWSSTTNPNAPTSTFLLPMPQDAYNAYGLSNFKTQPQIALTGERMMVTLFSRTGQITANSIEFFNVTDLNTPYYDSQLGAREAK